MRSLRSLAALALLAVGCEGPRPVTPAPLARPDPPATAPAARLDAIPRADFNRLAVELDLPLFWIADDGGGSLDPTELALLWRAGPDPGPFVADGAFTTQFLDAYAALTRLHRDGPADAALPEPERRRRAAVRRELAQGRSTLVRTELSALSVDDRALVAHVLEAAQGIERLYARQRGSFGLDAGIPADDPASRALFRRNQGPFCRAPMTENDRYCGALPTPPPRVSGLYPASVQADPKFCEVLEARKDQRALLGPFTVVVEDGARLTAIPYTEAYRDDMTAVSRSLAAAAAAVTSPDEQPLRDYLKAASQAFLDNQWGPADEAWVRMGADNSRWFLRVGPDEVQSDPCGHKAGFHLTFARINPESIEWQHKLDPLRRDMEAAIAGLAGAPYAARAVQFRLPDFLDIILNAGDARPPVDALVGQSLPNWGAVTEEGRSRTVAMTNLYTDPDSRAALRERTASVLCTSTLDPAAVEPAITNMITVLHEAAHNLGPSHDYRAGGKTGPEAFGGPLAGMLEELKAQSSALYLAEWLAAKGVVPAEQARLAHQGSIVWALGHIAGSMYGADGSTRPYAQLAAIQLGSFLKDGAIAFRPDELAENGVDRGCLVVVPDKLSPAIAAIERLALGIKARGDRKRALELRDEFVDRDGEWKQLRRLIAERWLRQPNATFVFSIAP